MGKAIHCHGMIRDGDHILVAVSGGKDSLALLWLLREHQARVPIKYRFTAVHVDPGFGADSATSMEGFFKEQGFPYRILRTDIGPIAHSPSNRENPCFLCSRLRRKHLFDIAAELSCEKIAFGHHKDDAIETFFLNVLYGGSLSTMMPVQKFFKGRHTVIRPLYLIEESIIESLSRKMEWPKIDLGCPSAGTSRRRQIKDILAGIYRSNSKIKGNIFNALHNIKLEYLPGSVQAREIPKQDR